VIKSFATDEYPTVRLIGTENLLPYLKALKVIGSDDATAAAAELLPIVKAAVEDPSWRVKLAISKDFGAYADVFSPDEVASEIFPSALRLIQDQEPDVRANAMRGMTQFVGVIPLPTFISEFLNIALHLLDDPYLTARELLAEVCIDIAAKAGADALNGPLRDAIMRLVNDEDPLVRLRILKKIPTIVTAVPALCTALTDNMKAMFVDTNWRVRKELALVMPSVYTHMGQDYFVDNFMPLFLVLLRDGVGEVTHPSAPMLSLSPLPHPSLFLAGAHRVRGNLAETHHGRQRHVDPREAVSRGAGPVRGRVPPPHEHDRGLARLDGGPGPARTLPDRGAGVAGERSQGHGRQRAVAGRASPRDRREKRRGRVGAGARPAHPQRPHRGQGPRREAFRLGIHQVLRVTGWRW